MGFVSLFVSDVFHLLSHAAPLDLFTGCARSTALFTLQQSSQGQITTISLFLLLPFLYLFCFTLLFFYFLENSAAHTADHLNFVFALILSGTVVYLGLCLYALSVRI